MSLWNVRRPVTVLVFAHLVACSGDTQAFLGPVDHLTGLEDADAATAAVRDAGRDASRDAGKSTTAADAALPGSDAGATVASGLPCDIDAMLQQQCRTCHGTHPIGGAPMALVTYADLIAPAPSDATKTNADVSLTRMQAQTMPPGGGVAAADLASFASWIQSGTPKGSCGSNASDAGVAPDPYNTPVTCSSNKMWTSGNRGSSLMHPGDACISCHSSTGGEAPLFSLAGTLYATAHEPSDCNGSSAAGATIVVTDAKGVSHTLTPNAAGNFSLLGAITPPYSAKLVYMGRTRAMATKQTDGDCNSCHTEAGDNGAPGRLMLP